MRVLIYKRTHKGDPDSRGIFGNQDCMGKVRNWDFDAVIGIGGKAPWRNDSDIRYKINWIGLGPHKVESAGRGPAVVFSNFALFEETGLNIEENFPNLFDYMYDSRKRFDMSEMLPEDVFKEVNKILAIATDYPPSAHFNATYVKRDQHDHFTTNSCSGCFNATNFELEIDQERTC
ncbi:hypothetical protein ACLI09_01810 [Flavobacterium sp. RHBU_24]|uniref:hypothetical protein n=1 Tax=Flavobacterium sp. RHBU_24 TaxID=3391185 RepID=UPI0039850040